MRAVNGFWTAVSVIATSLFFMVSSLLVNDLKNEPGWVALCVTMLYSALVGFVLTVLWSVALYNGGQGVLNFT